MIYESAKDVRDYRWSFIYTMGCYYDSHVLV